MDTPQPAPKPDGRVVCDLLLQWIDTNIHDHGNELKTLVLQRSAYGLAKYGQPLTTNDGRDDVIDAMQEAGDLLQYAFKAHLNGRRAELCQALAPVLLALMKLTQ